MSARLACLCVLLFAVHSAADEKKPAALTAKEIADGWVLLFDGESTFGWIDPWTDKAEVKDGTLKILDGRAIRFAATLPAGELSWTPANVPLGIRHLNGTVLKIKGEAGVKEVSSVDSAFRLELFGPAAITSLKFRPTGTEKLFNGKDLAGWKVFQDEKRAKSTFAVTAAGELSVKNGPGDLQSEKQFDDFLLQLECKTNGAALNSGVFFRCVADQYQNGYEMQIQNAYKDGDRTKPTDFGTGAIYRRVPARKVVANDNEWFALTLLAHGPQLATWVNGYPVVSWTDDRPADDNPRKGLRTAKGHLSLQGHDPTTDLLFRNIRVVEIK